MDIVYAIGRGSTWRNNELRYSLRSLKNIEHAKVFIVGDLPHWVTGVIHIPAKDHLTRKQLSIYNKISLAAQDERVSDDFIYFADDYYVLKPCKVGLYHSGPLSRMLTKYAGKYRQAVQNTIDIGGQNNYDIHTPFVYNKKRWDELIWLDWSKEYVIKSAYIRGTEGTEIEDAKVNTSLPYSDLVEKVSDWDFLSSGLLNPAMMKFLRDKFPTKCQYEN